MRVLALLARADERLLLDEASLKLARTLVERGFGAMDAVHVGAAEAGGCDILLPTDDALLRRARALRPPLRLRIENPVRWVAEVLES